MPLRSKLVRQRAGFKTSLKEQKLVYKVKDNEQFFDVQNKMIHFFTKQIVRIDSRIRELIKENKELKSTYNLVTSVKGIGSQSALVILVHTDCFSKFKT